MPLKCMFMGVGLLSHERTLKSIILCFKTGVIPCKFSSKQQSAYHTALFRLFKAESWPIRVIPSAGQGMVTLLLATLSKRASPGSAKEGASVKTGQKTN